VTTPLAIVWLASHVSREYLISCLWYWPSKFYNFKNPTWRRPTFWKKRIEKSPVRLIVIILRILFHLIKRKNYQYYQWNQFLLVVKSTALKQKILKFYAQILSTGVSLYVYDRPQTDINVIASVCKPTANLRTKYCDICCFRAVAFTTKRKWFQFCLIIGVKTVWWKMLRVWREMISIFSALIYLYHLLVNKGYHS